MESRYPLEEMVRTFSEHAVQVDKEREKYIEIFKKDYPNESLPEHFKEEFNIAKALHSICSEIVELKDRRSC